MAELAGSARLVLVDGVALLRPEDQVFQAMLRGWRNQHLARNLALRRRWRPGGAVRAFAAHANVFPWQWTAQLVDEWFSDLRSVRRCSPLDGARLSGGGRGFCHYLTDPAYGWAAECEQRFGTHPVQVIHELNTAVHVPRRSPTRPSGRSPWRSCRLCSTTPTSRWTASGRGAEGLVVGVPGRHPVQGRVRVRDSAQRDPDAGRHRFRH